MRSLLKFLEAKATGLADKLCNTPVALVLLNELFDLVDKISLQTYTFKLRFFCQILSPDIA
jgi:hypothetical protein